MTYRLRMILRKWYILVFDEAGNRIDNQCGGPYETIGEAEEYAVTLGYRDGDRG